MLACQSLDIQRVERMPIRFVEDCEEVVDGGVRVRGDDVNESLEVAGSEVKPIGVNGVSDAAREVISKQSRAS